MNCESQKRATAAPHQAAVSSRAPRPVELARRRLSNSGWRCLREVSCDEHEGVLTLRGCVPTWYLKQMAQALVSRIPGLDEIVNHIEVIPPAQEASSCSS